MAEKTCCPLAEKRQLAPVAAPVERNGRTPLTIGWQAARANLLPGLFVQAAMLTLLVAYYLSPAAAAVLDRVAEYKRAHGLVFVIAATVTAGAVLPELLLIISFQRGRLRAENFRNLLFTVPLWAVAGVAVDFLYRGLAAWLGDDVTVPVVLAKISIDQFVYNPLFAAPYTVIAYYWKNHGFSPAALRRGFTAEFYRDKIVPTLFATWGVWIPLTGMIYSLPLALQFPLFSLALTFWVLLLTYMTNRFAGKSGAPATSVPLETASPTAQ